MIFEVMVIVMMKLKGMIAVRSPLACMIDSGVHGSVDLPLISSSVLTTTSNRWLIAVNASCLAIHHVLHRSTSFVFVADEAAAFS